MRPLLTSFILLSFLTHTLVAGILLLAPSFQNRKRDLIAVSFIEGSSRLASNRNQAKQFVTPKKTVSKSAAREEVVPNFAVAEPTTSMNVNEPVPSDGSLITQGVRPINLDEVNKSIRRTSEAVQKNIEGHVKLKLLIDDQGVVRKVTPLTRPGFGLDEVAAAAAWKLTFFPARINSKAVALETLYTIKFNLTHQ